MLHSLMLALVFFLFFSSHTLMLIRNGISFVCIRVYMFSARHDKYMHCTQLNCLLIYLFLFAVCFGLNFK